MLRFAAYFVPGLLGERILSSFFLALSSSRCQHGLAYHSLSDMKEL